MKIVLLCDGGPSQRALAHRLHDAVGLSAIILRGPSARRRRWGDIVRALGVRTVGRPLMVAWRAMQAGLGRAFPSFPLAPAMTVADINQPEVSAWIEREAPDLVLVSGTNLLRRPLIEVAERTAPILNLHTGLSPYLKGGPNCTNWCLAIGRPDLIGNTVLWLDTGIDSGHLAATERTPLDGTETLSELHVKVMDHAHGLFVRAVRQYVETGRLPKRPQAAVGDGPTYHNRDWTPARMLRAVRYHRRDYARGLRMAREPIVTVGLDE